MVIKDFNNINSEEAIQTTGLYKEKENSTKLKHTLHSLGCSSEVGRDPGDIIQVEFGDPETLRPSLKLSVPFCATSKE